MFWSCFGRRAFPHLNTCTSGYCTATRNEVKKLTIRNVFKDTPAAKYYLLTALTVTGGVMYYIYKNQQKKRFILNLLPAPPNHYMVSLDDEVSQLKSLLEAAKEKLSQVQISGLPASGKTQLARVLAESLNEMRKESLQFRIWPRDEVTGTILANSKESLLVSLKQLASKLGCKQEDIKLESHNVEGQLDIFSLAVREKLKQKPCWIMVIDNHDPRKQLSKWLPHSEWGNGYVVYTLNSQNLDGAENDMYPNYCLDQMSSGSARKLFCGLNNEATTADLETINDSSEQVLKLLQYNPLSVTCAAIYFKHRVHQNPNYSHEDLCKDIDEAVQQIQEANPGSSKLEVIQTTSVTLATKVLGEQSPELLHVFDFVGSSNARYPIPITLFSHHLKTSEYHVQMKPEETLEPASASEDGSLSVNSNFEHHDHNLWSFRGIVDRAVKAYERVKLEVNAIKGLFGYGDAAYGVQHKQISDGLDVIRSCPLFMVSQEPMTDIEVITVHPIVHNVLRQVFVNVTIPLMEQQHLLLAERKHQQKSYFGRLQRFDPQSCIAEYRRGLGDSTALKVAEGDSAINLASEKGRLCVSRVLRTKNDGDRVDQSQKRFGHIQAHLSRVATSLSNHYRIAGGDSNAMVARAMLLPHLEALLLEKSLTPKSKAQVYRTMANIHSEVFGDYASGKQLLDQAYAVCKDRYGEDSVEIAGVLTELAELCSSNEELDHSKGLLERALEIYQKDIKTSQTNKQPFQYGKALVALGIICGSLGETGRSKDLLEKGLMEMQSEAPEDPHAKESKWFAAEISSAVTNLGHAYLSLGQINPGRKLLELALIGLQNVHGDAHQEIIRTLTTLSIAHAMQGNSQESKRLRNEAGKIQKKLDMKAPLFLH